jgi:pimeloyl-ACP methyl ester carboxylesterase
MYGRREVSITFKKPDSEGRITHLIVLVHGLMGFVSDFDYIRDHILDKCPGGILVVTPRENHGFASHEGIDIGGSRIAKRILQTVKEFPELQTLSVVAHSLGGLFTRYALKELRDEGITLEFNVFITLATPHLGSRQHIKVPIWKDFSEAVMRLGGSRSVRQLLLLDGDEKEDPLVVQMTSDDYLKPLREFKKRIAYSCIRGDTTVHYSTAAIKCKNPYKKASMPLPMLKDYPGIIDDDAVAKMVNLDDGELTQSFSDGSGPLGAKMKTMLERLNQLKWEKFAVQLGIITGHVDIVVQNKYWNSIGYPVVSHFLQFLNFEDQAKKSFELGDE